MSNLNQQIELSNRRQLGYDEHGPPDGRPLFYFHGSPSSRLEPLLFVDEELLHSLGVRLIAVDRPGMGLSDFQSDRQILDWPQDALAVADHLKIKQFAVLAYSLGGPYGLVCALTISDRLTNVGIVSGAALFTNSDLMKNINEGTGRFLSMPRENPRLARMYLGVMLGLLPRLAPRVFLAGASFVLPELDREIVRSERAFQRGFIRMVREATRQGTRGAFHESLLTVTDRGFCLQDIKMPVKLWHGGQDQNIPVEMARYMANAIPKCDAVFYPNEGHLSLFKKNVAEIIRSLVS